MTVLCLFYHSCPGGELASHCKEPGAKKEEVKIRQTSAGIASIDANLFLKRKIIHKTITLKSPGRSAVKETRMTSSSSPGGTCHADLWSAVPWTNNPGGCLEHEKEKGGCSGGYGGRSCPGWRRRTE